ncbi:hypothetical protein [Breoghania sp. L-A4]|uniref:hypothetical protein n=1 Tax=Breoghania sp. L-A4 TaxID=2304600 RepID=UPI0020BF78FD|nr:hypothetical protein [Breoghania sp. L-A4]
MTGSVSYDLRDGVAVITIDNPPSTRSRRASAPDCRRPSTGFPMTPTRAPA